MRFRSWLLGILGCGVIVFATTGFLSLGAFVLLSGRQAKSVPLKVEWDDPIDEIDTEKVWPGVGLLALTATDDLTAINQALAEDELDSAYALIALSTDLTDQERAGSLLLLGQRYATARDKDQARLCYYLVHMIATLSPTLFDFDRANACLQSGQGLSELDDQRQAKFKYDQARTIALYSPYLKKAHRKHILDRLIAVYTALGADRAEWLELEQYVALEGGESYLAGPGEESVLGDQFTQEAVLPEMQEAEAERQQAAQNLLEYYRDRVGGVPDILRENLAVALQVEDAVRMGTYEAYIFNASQLADKIALLQAKIDWLTIKYAVAFQAYGFSLVPEWESQKGKIQSELSKAYEELFALYGEQMIALPEAGSVDRAWVEVLRREVEIGQLGLYPNYPQEQLLEELREAMARLATGGQDKSLRLEVIFDQGTATFILTSGE